jgi:hypothetical protein
MADILKPGDIGLPSDGEPPGNFGQSMAQAIENELNSLLVNEGKPPLTLDNSSDSRDRRMLFVAIARGVARHLSDNAGAFKVHFQITGGVITGATITIDVQL